MINFNGPSNFLLQSRQSLEVMEVSVCLYILEDTYLMKTPWNLVEPYFRYHCPFWGSFSASFLEKLQELAASIVRSSPYDTSALHLIKNLGWLAIRKLIDVKTSKVVYESLSALASEYLRNIFQRWRTRKQASDHLYWEHQLVRNILLTEEIWFGLTMIFVLKRIHPSTHFVVHSFWSNIIVNRIILYEYLVIIKLYFGMAPCKTVSKYWVDYHW